ncbi:hypothetical protein [Psychrobium sp. 1_MG-2023]|uniref:hypothetical protein n=1 Tax=Psychrobium sp. 1_MG-2023 TaxID=3062624 RepID=UPI000C3461E3|nr:hypothetical protein [Psychrobium sp. 1_MG-2023]MDP2559656.1 hypothetical protein [Psychrobium sp. 1_MG-2023]PKF59487.1 hypothetical protein CW748_01575 [Alteromonadales bacterium alter-6D02]
MRVVINVLMGCFAILIVGKAMASQNEITVSPALLEDSSGLVYVGYKVEAHFVSRYLQQMHAILGEKSFNQYRAAQALRDHGSFHITLLNPFEYPKVATVDLSQLGAISFDFQGLGRASNDENTTFFVVASSDKAQQIRKQLGLGYKDFHVTLGFDKSDVFGVSKGIDSLIKVNKSGSL